MLANEQFSEYAIERLEISMASVSNLIDHLRANAATHASEDVVSVATRYSAMLAELLECLRQMYNEWTSYLEHFHVNRHVTSYSAPVTQVNRTGRPTFLISEAQLQHLRSLGFSWTQIAEILGVSYTTVYRRRREYGMEEEPVGNLTDPGLSGVVQQLKREFPSMGETMLWGQLRSMGFMITRSRVRHALREADPMHTALRWRGELTRRQPYSVPGPNSLWHTGKYILEVGVVEPTVTPHAFYSSWSLGVNIYMYM